MIPFTFERGMFNKFNTLPPNFIVDFYYNVHTGRVRIVTRENNETYEPSEALSKYIIISSVHKNAWGNERLTREKLSTMLEDSLEINLMEWEMYHETVS